jgi:hypothetical protein
MSFFQLRTVSCYWLSCHEANYSKCPCIRKGFFFLQNAESDFTWQTTITFHITFCKWLKLHPLTFWKNSIHSAVINTTFKQLFFMFLHGF